MKSESVAFLFFIMFYSFISSTILDEIQLIRWLNSFEVFIMNL